MASERSIRRYRRWYRLLLRLHSRSFRDRFREGMEQAFCDVLRERAAEGRGLLSRAVWMFAETSAGILREKGNAVLERNKRLVGILLVVGCLLLVQLTAMQFFAGVHWTLSDFVAAGGLLAGVGLLYDLAARMRSDKGYRAAAGVALAAALLPTCANLAVGIIGHEDNVGNAAFLAVPPLALLGAVVALFRPRGMAVAMFAAAGAQFLAPIVALAIGDPQEDVRKVAYEMSLNGLFVAMWAGAGVLFHRAGHRELRPPAAA